jgi:hypothetical protein
MSKIEEYQAPKDSKALITWIEKKRESGRSRLPEYQMKLNLAYTLGHQWVVWDREKRSFRQQTFRADDPNAPIRVTVNKVGAIVEHFIARILKSDLIPEVRPISDDDDDINTAKVGNRILGSELHRLHWKDKLMDLLFWETTLGWSYLHPSWDASAGPVAGSDTDGDLHLGDVSLEVVPAFELSVDPNAQSMEEATWAVRSVAMTKEAIWDRWGVIPDGDNGTRSLVDDIYSLTDPTAQANTKRAADTLDVNQFWMVPCRAKPDGMVITYCGTTVLEAAKPFPFRHGKLPFVQSDLLPGIGTREGRTWVTDLLPIQADYNDARSREAELRRKLTPKIIAPVGSIDPQRISSRVEVWTYNPVGEAPRFEVPPASWMQQYEGAMSRADSEMGERSGQNDVSSSQGSASMPAAAILALQEADDTKLAVPAKLLATAIATTGWQILELVKQFWSEERLVSTWSEEGMLEVSHFSGADINGQLDVRLSAESALPKSKSARAQLAMQLWDQKIVTDPRLYLRMLDMPGVDFITEQLSVDTKQAQRENDKLLFGEQCEVHDWDNHMVHISEHNDLRKSEEYEKLGPEERALIDAHANMHMSLVLGQLSQPVPTGTAHIPGAGQGPLAPGTPDVGAYMDPMTGKPPDGTQVAQGNAPSALDNGIGGEGQPGQAPGISPDSQAAQMGN